ncbi:MAG: hypothetical protein ACLFR0_01445 [Alphaproteobacteria bacterium]
MQKNTPDTTASFDFIKATAEGYKFLWQRRDIVLRLGFLPVIVKFICFIVVVNLGLENNFLRQGLLLFPAYLLEGYLVCTLVRLAVFSNEALVQPPGSGAFEYYKQRARDIQAGAILYTLIKLLAALLFGLIYATAPMRGEETVTPPNPGFDTFLAAMLMFVFMIWAFRLLWLNVAVTLGYSMRGYLKKVRGFSFSFHIFSVWIMCLLPFSLGGILIADILFSLTQGIGEAPSQIFLFLRMAIAALIETLSAIVSNIAIGFGIYWVMSGQNLKMQDPKK